MAGISSESQPLLSDRLLAQQAVEEAQDAQAAAEAARVEAVAAAEAFTDATEDGAYLSPASIAATAAAAEAFTEATEDGAYLSTSGLSAASATYGLRQTTGRKLLGGNIVPIPGTWGWRDLASAWDWDNWIRPQVDRARVLGFNAVRMILAPGVTLDKLSQNGSTAPTISMAVYKARLTQLASYLAANGMAFYPNIVNSGDYIDRNPAFDYFDAEDLAGTNFSNTEIIDAAAELAEHLATFSNVIAFDVFQENGEGVLEADILAVMEAVRAVAPRVPMTSSLFTGQWRNTALPNSHVLYDYPQGVGSDFADFHTYDSVVTVVDTDFPIATSGQKPLLIGEFGASVADGEAAGVAVFRATAAIHNRPGVLGSFVWALADQKGDDQPAIQYGVWDNTGFVAGVSPLSITTGQRTYLTDVLRDEFDRFDRAPKWEPPELLDEYARRPSVVPWGWNDAGFATLTSHARGLKVTCGGATASFQTTIDIPVESGKCYRARVELVPAIDTGRTFYLYLILRNGNTYVDAVIATGTEFADKLRPSPLELLWHFDPANAAWDDVDNVRVRIAIAGPGGDEVHYLLDEGSFKATT